MNSHTMLCNASPHAGSSAPFERVPSLSVLLALVLASLSLAGISRSAAIAADKDTAASSTASRSDVTPLAAPQAAPGSTESRAKAVSWEGCLTGGSTFTVAGEGLDSLNVQCATDCPGKGVSAGTVRRSRTALECRLTGDFSPGRDCTIGAREGTRWLIRRRVSTCQATGATALSKSETSATKPSTPKAAQAVQPADREGTTRLTALVRDVERAKSYEDIAEAFKRARLSKTELDQVKTELAKPHYQSHLKLLSKQAVASARKAGADAEAKARARVLASNRELERQHQEAVRRDNQRALALVEELKRSAVATARPIAAARRVSGSTERAPIGQSRPSPGDLARILEVEPETASPGGRVTLTGQRFGSTSGPVRIEIGGETRHPTVEEWVDGRIVLTIPRDLDAVVGELDRDARVWVTTPSNIATAAFRIGPNLVGRDPVILRLSSPTIRPGQSIAIEGRNFLSERPGTVGFEFRGPSVDDTTTSFTTTIDEWNDRYILATLGRASGLRETGGFIIVTDHRGRQARRPITFVPRLVSILLVNPPEGTRAKEVHCEVFSAGEGRPGILCMAGTHQTVEFFPFAGLQGPCNDWLFEDIDVVETEGFGSRGHRIISAPSSGSTLISTQVEAWADLYSWTFLRAHTRIRGPEGTDHCLRNR